MASATVSGLLPLFEPASTDEDAPESFVTVSQAQGRSLRRGLLLMRNRYRVRYLAEITIVTREQNRKQGLRPN